MNKANLVRNHSLLDLWLKLSLGILNIFVTFHGVGLASTSLSVGEKRRMVAVNNLADHAFHPDLLIERPLVELAIADPIKLVGFRFLVPGVEL